MAEKENKTNFIGKVIGFVSSPFGAKEEKVDEIIENSKYKHYLDDIDKNSSDYKYIEESIKLCEDASRVLKRRSVVKEKIKKLDLDMEEVECFYKLSENDTKKLNQLIARFLYVSKEKSELQNQLSAFDAGLSNLENLETDANFALAQIQDAEKKQRILRHDIGYLEGERSDLEYDKERLEKSFEVIKRVSLAVVSVFSVVACILAYQYIFMEQDIRKASLIMSICMMVTLTVIFIFRRRARYEIRLNVKKQNKAVELLNKKNVVIAYYTNFLKYEYRKYKVHNSQTLKGNLKDLEHYKHINKRCDSLRRIMYKTEEEIETFLRHKKIKSSISSLEKFIKTLNLENKQARYKELNNEKLSFEEELSQLEIRHDEIWDSLIVLNDTDPTDDKLVESLIQDYFDEINESSLNENNDGIDKEALIV